MNEGTDSSHTMRISILPEDQEIGFSDKDTKSPVKRIPSPISKPTNKEDNPQFHELFQSLYDAAILSDMNGAIVDVNVRALEFLLFDKAAFEELSILDIISGSDET
ncbi:MAG: hypothetical protein GX811_05860, partial [Lentisphaerae bacterium]|nr:hypothetical protein [Lentisphaerota bacterium]